jgi:hypothetical protein
MEQGTHSETRSNWPAGGYERFIACLQEDQAAQRVRDYFIPRCDFVKVYAFALNYVRDDHSFTDERKAKLKDLAADLHHEKRRLEAEVASVWHPAKGETIEDYFSSSEYLAARECQWKFERLDDVRAMLANIPRAANTKRAGIGGDLRYLYIIREYLQAKSGVLLDSDDLAAIVNAAYYVMDADAPRNCNARELSGKIKRFESNCSEFCALARGEARRLAGK